MREGRRISFVRVNRWFRIYPRLAFSVSPKVLIRRTSALLEVVRDTSR